MKVHQFTVVHHNRKVFATAWLPEKESCPLVLFSHGFNGTGDDFKAPAEILAKEGIAAVTYDFCGGSLASRSDLKTTEMTVFTEKEDLLAVLDSVKTWPGVDVDRIFLFGASMGGLISALAAEERGDEIRGMILLFPALCIADNWNKRFPRMEDIPETVALWEVPLGKRFFETLHGVKTFDHLGGYSGEILILHGDEDPVVPVEYSKKANELYPHSRLEIFPGEGHGFSPAGNEKVTRMLLQFVLLVGNFA
ncbi:MAG: lysophospholipase [Roseburia sp.]|nr:lysophospholipase [Roseburia sp.]MCM1098153.1 lysophospholipase [Ruminococcus flavefaciens]